MYAETIPWSEERQKSLQEPLVDLFASDVWRVGPPHQSKKQHMFDFSGLLSPALKVELKYAAWWKFHRKEWDLEGCRHDRNGHCLRLLIPWLNRVAPHGTSLVEKSLGQWELSLRTHLTKTGQLRQDHPRQK